MYHRSQFLQRKIREEKSEKQPEQGEGGEKFYQVSLITNVAVQVVTNVIPKESRKEVDPDIEKKGRAKEYFEKIRRNSLYNKRKTKAKEIFISKVSEKLRQIAKNSPLFIGSAGGIVTLVIIPLVLVIGTIYKSPLAVLFPSLQEGDTVVSVANKYLDEFHDEIDMLVAEHEGHGKIL